MSVWNVNNISGNYLSKKQKTNKSYFVYWNRLSNKTLHPQFPPILLAIVCAIKPKYQSTSPCWAFVSQLSTRSTSQLQAYSLFSKDLASSILYIPLHTTHPQSLEWAPVQEGHLQNAEWTLAQAEHAQFAACALEHEGHLQVEEWDSTHDGHAQRALRD